ncbi:MAG TPA: YfdX family protein [Terriglobia bacterium]|nr:YfdX family protein [Terriglobia bacterium]
MLFCRRTSPWKAGITAILLVLSLGLYACKKSEDKANAAGPSSPAPGPSPGPANVDLSKQEQQAEQQNPRDLEQRRMEAQQQAEKQLDQDAIAAVQETRNALKAINENKIDEARAAIERAAGKIDILLARNEAAAFVPVRSEVVIIDAAPRDINAIRKLKSAAGAAVDDENYPAARVLLHRLASEILVRTYNLPLGTYPEALKTAARFLDQHQTKAAAAVLQTTLNTLAIMDKGEPLPLLLAQKAVEEAEKARATDKEAAEMLLTIARTELERARLLGYAGKDPEYAALDKSISDLQRQLHGNEDTGPAFSKLKERLGAFCKKQSDAAQLS